MKVLLADALPTSAKGAFEEAGYEVVDAPELGADTLVAAVREHAPAVLVVRSTKVPEAVLEAGPLELVIRAGAGVNNIDVEAASRRGILVANCPGKNAIAVAELAMGLLLALDRYIPECDVDLREGRWNKKAYAKARGLFGRTLGIVGVGRIGLQVIHRAQAFGMHVVAWSRSLTPEWAAGLGIEAAESPEAVAARADAVSVHLALTPDTRGSIGRAFFEALRPGALFINTSRGDVVDADALEWAVRERDVRAGLDVWWRQPKESVAAFDDHIGALEGVIGTHHIGASTEQAQEAVAEEAVHVARVYKETGEAPNAVNVTEESQAPCALLIRHRDEVGVLAHVLECLRGASVNVQEMENVILDGGAAALATIRMHAEPAPETVEAIASHEHVLGVRLAR